MQSHHLIFKSSHHLIHFCFLLSAFCFLLSCNNPSTTGVIQNSATKTEETDPFILGNKKIVELENEDIELFLKRYKWEMKKTETGLRYEILKEGDGQKIKLGETVTIEYNTLLLSGEEIYNSKDDGEKQFVVEKTEEIAGLHEAVQLMNKGGEARLIIPSHLAYGAAGDGNRIRQYQTIIMRVKIKN
jgi:FKBP-type peptidyl-prolyl cis-trans isomerase